MSEENQETTTFENQCKILSELWVDYRDEPDLQEFVVYNDLGLPLAFAVSESLVTPVQMAKDMIEESFTMLLASLGVEDAGFENFEELMLG